MNDDRSTEHWIRGLVVETNPTRDREILDNLLRAQATARPSPRSLTRPALAAGLSLAAVTLLTFLLSSRSTASAWVIADTIAALRLTHAAHIHASTPAGAVEMWMRSDPAATQSTDILVHAPGGVVIWTKDGRTFEHDPASNVVYSEPCITAGVIPWLDPGMLEVLASAPGSKTEHGRNGIMGREIVRLTGSIIDVSGPQSWVFTFDAETHLPVSFKVWPNIDRQGPPAFNAKEITFSAELPSSLFDVNPPPGVPVVERPLSIPEVTVGMLANPEDGIPVDGLDRQNAAERILTEMVRAMVDNDVPAFRRLVPLARNWSEGLIKLMILSPRSEHQRITEVVKIGRIDGTGRSSAGPIVALPLITKRADGSMVRDRMIVQFRNFGGAESCVVFGPHGLPVTVD